MKDRAPLREALRDPNVRAFMAVLDLGEHGPNADSPERYRTLYGGALTSYLDDHPRRKVTAAGLTSTAAGRGQFLERTWDGLRALYGFENFGHDCQDEAIVALIDGRKALDDVKAGRFEEAIRKCAKEWASLPGSPYGQPTLTMDRARDRYLERGGFLLAADPLATEHYGEAVTESTINPVPSPDEQEANMAPLIIPLLQVAAQFIPQIAEKFGSGSEVANRNLAAGKVLAEAITTATNSPNLQAAVEKMAAGDPVAVQAAKVAVAQEWPDLFEVGGGIIAARKVAEVSEGDWRKVFISLPFAVILLLMPIVYFVVYHVITGAEWSADVKAGLVSAVISGVLFGITGYALGTSYGSQRKTNILANKE